jgi:hypothetical protein
MFITKEMFETQALSQKFFEEHFPDGLDTDKWSYHDQLRLFSGDVKGRILLGSLLEKFQIPIHPIKNVDFTGMSNARIDLELWRFTKCKFVISAIERSQYIMCDFEGSTFIPDNLVKNIGISVLFDRCSLRNTDFSVSHGNRVIPKILMLNCDTTGAMGIRDEWVFEN